MIRQLIHDQALRSPDRPAILAPGHAGLSYAGLERVVEQAGDSMTRLGINRASRVALVCSNGAEMAAAFLSVASYAACAPLNPGYRAAEFELYLSDLRPQALILETGLDCAALKVASRLGIPVLELRRRASGIAGDIEITGPGLPRAAPAPASESDSIALLLHTSGTTSQPKLVPLTRANLCSSARHIAGSLALTPADRCLNVMPLFHIHGLEAALLASIASGGSVICSPGFLAPRFFDWVEEFQPTWFTAVPTVHQSILARASSNGATGRARSLRFIRSCSSALPPSVMEKMEATFRVPMIQAYGMTEAAHQVASNPLPPLQRKPGSVGLATGCDIAIVDDAGAFVPREISGEVVIRGPSVTRGYAGNPDANAASFAEGWFRTGDEGYLDADGYLFLNGRKKELINRGGEKIAPREIDEVLLRHPKIEQAVAFAAPHPVLGESVAAAVVPRKNQDVTPRELRYFSAQYLADFKVPEQILVVEEIPKGPTGKVQRIGLAAKLGIGEKDSKVSPSEFVAPATKRERKIANLFATTLNLDRIGLHDNFFDRGGDSLLAAVLLAQIEELTGSTIPLFEFAGDPSVCGVCNSLDAPVERRPVTGDLATVIRSGQGEPILFCVPGSEGDITGFFHLARRLGTEPGVTAFRLPPGGPCSVGQLAARYSGEVLEAQPDGPYYLAGVCSGGIVAYEMASLLIARGKEVALLALIDCYNHACAAELPFATRLGYRVDLLRRRFVYQTNVFRTARRIGISSYLREKIAAFSQTARQRYAEAKYRLHAGLKITMASDSSTLLRLTAAQYVPAVLPVKLELFRPEEPRVDGYDYPEMGWRGLAEGGISVHSIPGGHRTMLAPPGVDLVAQRLQASMNAFAGRPLER